MLKKIAFILLNFNFLTSTQEVADNSSQKKRSFLTYVVWGGVATVVIVVAAPIVVPAAITSIGTGIASAGASIASIGAANASFGAGMASAGATSAGAGVASFGVGVASAGVGVASAGAGVTSVGVSIASAGAGLSAGASIGIASAGAGGAYIIDSAASAPSKIKPKDQLETALCKESTKFIKATEEFRTCMDKHAHPNPLVVPKACEEAEILVAFLAEQTKIHREQCLKILR